MTYQLSKHTEVSLRERVELFLVRRQSEPHVDSNLNWHLQAVLLVHGVLREVNKSHTKKKYIDIGAFLKWSDKIYNKTEPILFIFLDACVYLKIDRLHLAAVFTTGLLTVGGKQDLVSRDATVGHPLLTSQHPDDHIRHAVLGLDTVGNYF